MGGLGLCLALGGGGFGGQAPMQGGGTFRTPSQTGMSGMGMMGMMGKRARMAADSETKLLVPVKQAGAVIGKGAAGLKMLRETYGCRVEVLGREECCQRFADDRVVMLSGPLQARQAAACAVLQLVYPEGPMQFKVVLPSKKVGAVIGKGASTLQSLRQQTGCSVQVEKSAFDGERVVRTSKDVAHSSAQVMAVARLVIQVSETRSDS